MLNSYLNIPIKNISSVQNNAYTASTFFKPLIERYGKFVRDGFSSTFTEPRCSSLVWGRIESFFFIRPVTANLTESSSASPLVAFGVKDERQKHSFEEISPLSTRSQPVLSSLRDLRWSHLALMVLERCCCRCRLVVIGDNWTAVYLRDHLIVLISWIFFYPHRKWNELLLLFSIQEWRTLARTTQSGYF